MHVHASSRHPGGGGVRRSDRTPGRCRAACRNRPCRLGRGAMQRSRGYSCGSTLRQRYDEAGSPCNTTMGGLSCDQIVKKPGSVLRHLGARQSLSPAKHNPGNTLYQWWIDGFDHSYPQSLPPAPASCSAIASRVLRHWRLSQTSAKICGTKRFRD
jgi:hypothetical protein